MQAEFKPFYQFIEGSDKVFHIPVFQRNYSWKKADCKKLWDDLLSLKDNKRETHFMGTIVVVPQTDTQMQVIDGQQRITTLSLFLKAFHDALEYIKPEDANISPERLQEFLINKYSKTKDTKLRLKPNNKDEEIFGTLFEKDQTHPFENSYIFINYRFFKDHISAFIKNHSDNELYELFKKLTVVIISLDKDKENPQLIFESLNSTGVDLTPSDLIRNFILMGLEPEMQNKYYRDFWNKIEKNTDNTSTYMQQYLSMRDGNFIIERQIYDQFKLYAKEKAQTKEDLLNDLLHFSHIYYKINNPEYNSLDELDKKIIDALMLIKKLEFRSVTPFLMYVLDITLKKELSEDECHRTLITLYHFLVRKTITDSNKQFNKIFPALPKHIKQKLNNGYGKEGFSFYDVYAHILTQRREYNFPKDIAFRDALIIKDMYNNSRMCKLILGKIENHNNPYPIQTEEYTIEHILPQKLNKKDENKLRKMNKDYREIHNSSVHRLGNLTLASQPQNATISNKGIFDKIKEDYEISKFIKLNKSISDWHKTHDNGVWFKDEIDNRSNELAKILLEVFKYPEVKIENNGELDSEEIITLSDDPSKATGTKPFELYIKTKEYEVKKWVEVWHQVVAYFYEEEPEKVFQFIQKNNLVPTKPEHKALVISPKLSIIGNRSTEFFLSNLAKLAEEIQFDKDDVAMAIKW